MDCTQDGHTATYDVIDDSESYDGAMNEFIKYDSNISKSQASLKGFKTKMRLHTLRLWDAAS